MASFIKVCIILMAMTLYTQTSVAEIVAPNDEQVNIDKTIYTVQAIGPYLDPDEIQINNKYYDPKTYCDVAVGDRIKFVMNTPYDCVDAKLLNLRTHKECDVWCDF